MVKDDNYWNNPQPGMPVYQPIGQPGQSAPGPQQAGQPAPTSQPGQVGQPQPQPAPDLGQPQPAPDPQQPIGATAPDPQQPMGQPQFAPAAQPAPQPEPGPQPAPAAQPAPQPEPAPQSAPAGQQAPAGQPAQQPAPAAAAPQPGPVPPAGAPSQPIYYLAPAPVAAAPQKKSYWWIVSIVFIVCLFAFTAFAVNSCSKAVSSLGGSSSSGYDLSSLSGDTVAVITISGTISYDGTECSPEGLKTLLDDAEENANIKAVVLRVDSGGGTATAGEEMAKYVRDFSKPIVVSSASINASAAYEISSQTDYIYVAKSTEIGAIGTAMQISDISGLLDLIGVNMEVITSAEEKDSSYGYRPLTDKERAEYQAMVDQINGVFIENVAEGRHMSVEDVKALATGMPFTGIDAVKNGLADEVGTREDAIAKAASLAGIKGDYDTYELSLSTYDISSLAYLLGKTDASTEDVKRLNELLDLLDKKQIK